MSREPIPLSESLGAVLRSLRADDATAGPTPSAAATGGVFARWEDAVGASVAAHAQPVKLDGTTLVVEVDDPAWATQIRFFEATLARRLAEVAGARIDAIEVRVRRR